MNSQERKNPYDRFFRMRVLLPNNGPQVIALLHHMAEACGAAVERTEKDFTGDVERQKILNTERREIEKVLHRTAMSLTARNAEIWKGFMGHDPIYNVGRPNAELPLPNEPDPEDTQVSP